MKEEQRIRELLSKIQVLQQQLEFSGFQNRQLKVERDAYYFELQQVQKQMLSSNHLDCPT